ncbi:hypothetical protein GUJ93_ZPchr0006g41921 [Zizania palustris]|uniref:Uncharacterized protein n=1 Tax=Zizania palustris TaxID=103762 RepID=A0A8J5SIG3_ZIZPA|nr:hypothetical protein GUJ93_ZPchr0006g41921 [Zizania palustris]
MVGLVAVTVVSISTIVPKLGVMVSFIYSLLVSARFFLVVVAVLLLILLPPASVNKMAKLKFSSKRLLRYRLLL